MKSTRRLFFSQVALVAGTVAIALPGGNSLAAEDNCDQTSCDPFPIFGDKPPLSREEFNKMAESIADDVIDGIKNTDSIKLEDGDIDKIRDNVYKSVENTISKYRAIQPK